MLPRLGAQDSGSQGAAAAPCFFEAAAAAPLLVGARR
jgi:hypothetical protein